MFGVLGLDSDNIQEKNGLMSLNKEHLQFIFDQYGKKLQKSLAEEEIENIKQQEKNQDSYQNYYNFQWILWYYYYYYPDMYEKLINEYNHRMHNYLLDALGLPESFSPNKDLKSKSVSSKVSRGSIFEEKDQIIGFNKGKFFLIKFQF